MSKWSYGVTTTCKRLTEHLPKTLENLKYAGFDSPRIFIDSESEKPDGTDQIQLPITFHHPPLNAFGNWIIALWELWIREPQARFYALFQDDIDAVEGLREYLEEHPCPENGYMNLYTVPSNQEVFKEGEKGWKESATLHDHTTLQTGRGALGLVFTRDAVQAVLSAPTIVAKPSHVRHPTRSIDGAVVTALNNAGFREYVHNPSLLQHTGEVTTIGTKQAPKATSFVKKGLESPPWTVADLLKTLPKGSGTLLPRPKYEPRESIKTRIGLAVASMRDHMTDEGWQIFDGLQQQGYTLYGSGLPKPYDLTNVMEILESTDPDVVFLQDKREWDTNPGDFRDSTAFFLRSQFLKELHQVFRITILKDAHQRNAYHREAASDIGCHKWVTYYHPEIVKHLAPYVRSEDLIRTYHTLDPVAVPDYSAENRNGVIISGAVSTAYPLRERLIKQLKRRSDLTILEHPGYHRDKCHTPEYLEILSHHKVAICTASRYGYLLRKIIEATAAGCVVVTDLPVDERVPEIDGNLVRVHPDSSLRHIEKIIDKALTDYSPAKQKKFAKKAVARFDYRVETARLAELIESHRQSYQVPS